MIDLYRGDCRIGEFGTPIITGFEQFFYAQPSWKADEPKNFIVNSFTQCPFRPVLIGSSCIDAIRKFSVNEFLHAASGLFCVLQFRIKLY